MKIEKNQEGFHLHLSQAECRFLMKALRSARERHLERMSILPSSAFKDDEFIRKADATKEGIWTFLEAYFVAERRYSVVTHTTDETFDIGREYL